MTKTNKDQPATSIQSLPDLLEALKKHPDQAELHNNLGNAYKLLGKIPEALQHYHEALRLKSPYPEAQYNLGALLYKLGQTDESIQHFQKALRSNPNATQVHYHLALAYLQQNRLLDSIPHLEIVLKHNPEYVNAIHNLGIAYTQLKRYEEAEPLLLKAVEHDPSHIEALYHLAVVQSCLGKLSESEICYKKILALHPQHAIAHHNLATLYLAQNKKDNALLHFQQALEIDSNNLTAKHMIAALTGISHPEGAPPEYTRALFNQYAFNYDEHVKSALQYEVPNKLRSLLSPYTLHLSHLLKVLDLGCGTGICAPYFRDIAADLTGIDLSENMLFQAKKMGGYDKLIQAEALQYLTSTEDTFDLIIAADVLVYMGDLNKLFEMIKKCLKENGIFSFSTEKAQDNASYILQTSGRYAHAYDYIISILKSHQFELLSHVETTLRLQDNIPLMGDLWIVKTENVRKID